MKYKFAEEDLKKAIKNNLSWASTCRYLGIKDRGGNQSNLKNTAIKLGIDFSHFTGKGWLKNKTYTKVDINEYLQNNKKINSHNLKIKLFKTGVKKKECEICGTSNWLGEEVVFELDHIDSNHHNNFLNNLQILCPNCHAMETRKRINSKKFKKLDKRKTERKIRLNTRKVKNRPELNTLINDVKLIGYRGTGKKYNVSDNCIRKWIKSGIAGMQTEQP